jgi:hypothetical protein
MKYLVVRNKWHQSLAMPCRTWPELRRAVMTARVNGYKYKLKDSA